MTIYYLLDAAVSEKEQGIKMTFFNPSENKWKEVLDITFKSYRHWGGFMIAHYTNGNVLTVKKMLRHKCILNTMKYIHTIDFAESEFETTTATTPEEILRLRKSGWQKYDEMTVNKTQMHFYCKPKRFEGL